MAKTEFAALLGAYNNFDGDATRQRTNEALMYAALFLLLMLSGNPAAMTVMGDVKLALPLLIGFELFALLLCNRMNDIIKYILILAPWFLIELYHLIDYNPLVNVLGVLSRMTAAYLLCVLLRDRFVPMFIRVMCFLAGLSLPFFLLLVLYPKIPDSSLLQSIADMLNAKGNSVPLLLHTYLNNEEIRNSGCFWEPGAFGGYLMLAILLLGESNHDIPFKKFSWPFILLSTALLTTTSTTAYITYFLYLIYMVSTRMIFHNLMRLILMLPLIILAIWYNMMNSTFLLDKLQKQYEMTQDQSYGWEITRFGTLLYDMTYIEEKPLLGWGSYVELRLHNESIEIMNGKGNGFSDFAVRNGLLGLLIYLGGVFCFMQRMTNGKKTSSLVILGLIITLLQGEVYLNYPLFLTLMFMGYAAMTDRAAVIRNEKS